METLTVSFIAHVHSIAFTRFLYLAIVIRMGILLWLSRSAYCLVKVQVASYSPMQSEPVKFPFMTAPLFSMAAVPVK